MDTVQSTIVEAASTDSSPGLPCDATIDPSVEVDVVMWHALDSRVGSLLEQWAGEFHALHPSVTIRFENGGSGQDTIAALDAMGVEDRPSVVVVEDDSTADAVASGFFEPIGDCADRSEPLLPPIAASFTVDGTLQAAPFTISVPLLYYDRDAFVAVGLDPDAPPRTFTDIADAARRLLAAGAVDTGLILDARPNAGGSWVVEQVQAQVGVTSLNGDNGHTARPSTVTWDTPEVVTAISTFQSMLVDGSAELITDFPNDFSDLQRVIDPERPAAMVLHTSGSLGPVLEIFGDDPDRVRVAPYPAVLDDARGVMPGGRALWLVSGATEAERAAVWAWMEYLMSPHVQARLAIATGYVPVHPSSMDDEAMVTAAATWPQLLVGPSMLDVLDGRYANAFPVTVHRSETREILATAVMSAFVDGVDPAGALQEAASRAEPLVG